MQAVRSVVHVFCSVLQNSGELFIYSQIIDITDVRKLESENEQLLRAVEQTGEALVITDRQGLILYVNPAFEAISGYRREEVLEKARHSSKRSTDQ